MEPVDTTIPATVATDPAAVVPPPEVAATPLDQAVQIGQTLLEQGAQFLENLLRPWVFYQICIGAVVYLAAHLLRHVLDDPSELA